MLLILLDLG